MTSGSMSKLPTAEVGQTAVSYQAGKRHQNEGARPVAYQPRSAKGGVSCDS